MQRLYDNVSVYFNPRSFALIRVLFTKEILNE